MAREKFEGKNNGILFRFYKIKYIARSTYPGVITTQEEGYKTRNMVLLYILPLEDIASIL